MTRSQAFAHVLLGFFSVFAFAQTMNAQVCVKSPSDITIRGFRIGMTESEALKLYPLLPFQRPTDKPRESIVNLDLTTPDADELGENRKGLENVYLLFVDRKLVRAGFDYKNIPNWKSVDEFTAAIIGQFSLPPISAWRSQSPTMNQRLRIDCRDFSIFTFTEFRVGRYESSSPNLTLRTLTFDDDQRQRNEEILSKSKLEFRPSDRRFPRPEPTKPCSVVSSGLPLWKLRLGMSPKEVKRIYRQLDDGHPLDVIYYPGKIAPDVDSGDPNDLPFISLDFLDEKLVRIALSFGEPDWLSVDEFSLAVAGPLGLPSPSAWTLKTIPKSTRRILTTECSDFVASIIFEPAETKHSSQAKQFVISIKDYDQAIRKRIEVHKKAWKP